MPVLTLIKKELKGLAPIAIPAVFSQLAQMAAGIIDTVMAGQYSNEALAAVAIGTSILHPVLVFFLGLFLAFNPIVAHFKGADEDEKIGQHFRFACLLAIAFSPLAIGLLLNSSVVLAWLEVQPDVAKISVDYLAATAWGIPCLMLFMALRFCNEGLFSTAAVMVATLLSIPFNIFFNYWFMYGGTPFNLTWLSGLNLTPMSTVGVGYATSLVWSIMFVALLFYTLITRKYAVYNIASRIKLPSILEMWEVLRLGIPMAITLGFEITMFATVALMIARYPTEIMGAHQIANNIASISFMIPLGMSQAITARVGYFAGKKDFAAARWAGNVGIASALVFSFFSATAMVFLSAMFVSFYTSDNYISTVATGLLFFAAIFQFSDSLQVSSAGALRGLKDTKFPMLMTAIAYWLVGFPMGYYMAEHMGYQANGYWMGLIAGLSSAAILLLHRWYRLTHSILLPKATQTA